MTTTDLQKSMQDAIDNLAEEGFNTIYDAVLKDQLANNADDEISKSLANTAGNIARSELKDMIPLMIAEIIKVATDKRLLYAAMTQAAKNIRNRH